MSEQINTQKRTNQYGGNYSSSEYNKRVEENYQDLVYLYNKYNLIDKKIDDSFSRVMTDHVFISRSVKDLVDRIKALEAVEKSISIHSFSQIDNNRFSGETDYQISSAEQLSFNSIYNYLTLPTVSTSSISVLKTINSVGDQVIPDFINLRVSPVTSLDRVGALIDTTPPYYCLYDRHDRVWRRSVIVDTPDDVGASMYLYIKVPQNMVNQKINNIRFTPYPMNSVDILSIEFTQATNPTLSSGDGWRPLNQYALYNDDPDAVGYVPPGGWINNINSDVINGSGPLFFNLSIPQTDNKPVTGIRIYMRQRNYIKENNKYIYSYGLSDLDVRVDKYMPKGRAFIKFTAPENTLIYNVTNVTPKIYNVPLSLLEMAASTKVIYPTAGGGFSESPQGGSSHVWVEVTLNQMDDGTIPVLSDLVIKYS